MTNDQIVFHTRDFGSNVPFLDDTVEYHMSVGDEMFKESSLMGKFSLPPLPPTTSIAHINIISSFTNGSHGSFNPLVVIGSEDIESHGSSMALTIVTIVDLRMILSKFA